ncbi:hypothetical protein DEU56DRAFT_908435 [Suillus clintonianus]|uniref:uncharacterized protein n=1 Tax=Suillus clintonianus TaxID=1904413 RepID=UPI001B87C1F9|nr:uncharacterized protein DEU56DRAFT_908435 [Suillus clintonianus]KAG2150796.1 hypothetical protein DEU56DRAFT_908435 [Suillus clintonianus]
MFGSLEFSRKARSGGLDRGSVDDEDNRVRIAWPPAGTLRISAFASYEIRGEDVVKLLLTELDTSLTFVGFGQCGCISFTRVQFGPILGHEIHPKVIGWSSTPNAVDGVTNFGAGVKSPLSDDFDDGSLGSGSPGSLPIIAFFTELFGGSTEDARCPGRHRLFYWGLSINYRGSIGLAYSFSGLLFPDLTLYYEGFEFPYPLLPGSVLSQVQILQLDRQPLVVVIPNIGEGFIRVV